MSLFKKNSTLYTLRWVIYMLCTTWGETFFAQTRVSHSTGAVWDENWLNLIVHCKIRFARKHGMVIRPPILLVNCSAEYLGLLRMV